MLSNPTNPPQQGSDNSSGGSLEGEFAVVLLYGKNSFGDKIYSYVKLLLSDFVRLKAAMKAGGGFNVSDYGTILAAGRGEPTDEIKMEMASVCPVVDSKTLPAGYVHSYNPAAINTLPKKAWDEF